MLVPDWKSGNASLTVGSSIHVSAAFGITRLQHLQIGLSELETDMDKFLTILKIMFARNLAIAIFI